MATTVAVDERLVQEARHVGRHGSREEALETAHQEYIKRNRRLGILDLRGQIEYDADYDYKALRQRQSA